MHKYLGYDIDDNDFAPLYYPREREDLVDVDDDAPEMTERDLSLLFE